MISDTCHKHLVGHTLWLITATALWSPVARAADAIVADKSPVAVITITARKLDKARDNIQPSLGAATYVIGKQAILAQPGGANVGLNELLLQAPGVTKDSDGQIHIRNEHGNLQYRVNGVIVPEGISGFGQALDTRVADNVSLLTGALPAQYGYRTAGVVNLTTKSGSLKDGGEIGIYGGSFGAVQPSAEVQGSRGGLSYFVSASYLQNQLGIENPTASRIAIHDETQQGKLFAYVSDIVSDETRLSGLFGGAIASFQIPGRPNQPATLNVAVDTNRDSATLDQNQHEYNFYGVLSAQHSHSLFNIVVAPFVRYSRTRFSPDPRGGDLIFGGVSDNSELSSLSVGVQSDASYKLNDYHTVRAGLFVSAERTCSNVISQVLPLPALVAPLGFNKDAATIPLSIADANSKTGWLYGLYVQDEWTLSDQLTVNYGARLDLVRAYTHEQQVSPRLNVVYKPFTGSTLHFGYARNFTPPPQELIAPRTVALFNGTVKQAETSLNDPVKSEREHYFDVGVLQTVLPGFDIGLDVYYKIKKNLLDEGQFGESLIFSPFNYATGYSKGVELSANYHHGAYTAYANAALAEEKGSNIISSQFFFSKADLDAIAVNKIHTDHDQKWTISAGGSYNYKYKLGTLVPSFDLIYGSGLRATPVGATLPNSGTLAPYAVVNFGIAQNFKGMGGWLDGITLRADMTNLFDESYLVRDGSGVGVGAPQYGARRGFYAGVSKAF